MLRILVVSDSPTFSTGYSTTIKVINDIFLECGCEVRQIAWGLHEETPYKYRLYPTPKNDYFGKTIFKHVVEEYLPHIVFSFADLHNISWIALYPNAFFKWWGYFPVDSENLTYAQTHIIKQMDMPIVYSKTGLFATINATQREDTKLIYHGLDTNKFKPIDKQSIKSKYGLANKFVVGSVGRNNARKNFPALIKAFSKFAEGKNDAVLYLHTSPIDSGHNLYEYIKQYNLTNEKVYITKDLNPIYGIDDNRLIEVYNLFDIFVSTTAGEGFGLPILESQLCETPALVTDFGTCKEFVLKEMRIKKIASYYEAFWDVERAIIDEEDLVKKLNLYYENQYLLPTIGKQSRDFLLCFDWKNIKPLWKYLIENYGKNDLAEFAQDFVVL